MKTSQRFARVFPPMLVLCVACSDAPAEAPTEIERVVVTQWNDSTELFLEYPHPVAGTATGNWAIHLTDMADFSPIRSGSLTVVFTGTDARTFTLDAPARDGIFLLDPLIERPGLYQVELVLSSPQTSSRHVLPEVRVFASLGEAPVALEEEEAGGIAFLKEQQWVIPFQVERADERQVQRTVTASGEIVPPDGALVQVSAPVDGIAPPVRNRAAPSVGARVSQGQVLAVLDPTPDAGSYTETRGRVERLQREVQRLDRLFAVGAVPERRLEEARHDLELARAELEGMGGSTEGELELRLTAPIAGVVAGRSFVPGGRVAAGEPLFTIVDPRSAWLRVQMPAEHLTGLVDAPASFTVEGSDQLFETTRLVAVGSVLDPRTRTVPAVWEIPSPAGVFAFGQMARAAVPVGGSERGVAIPNSAILDDAGTPVAYVQTEGETFERRVLTLGASDGGRTHVRAGIRPGEMVVSTGAYQVRLASLSGGEFAGGHAH